MALEASLFSDQSRLNGLIMRIPQADSGAPSLGIITSECVVEDSYIIGPMLGSPRHNAVC